MPAIPYSRYIFGSLPWYSVLIVSGMALALWHCSREEKRLGLPADTTIDLALCVIPCGILGARLYYVIFSWASFAGDPLQILRIWEGGLAVYGGVIGGLLAAVAFSRRRKLPLSLLTDIMVPGVILAQAIGRWGNYFNMEAYGAAIANPAWQFFPAGVLIPENGGYIWHMATFFYESIWNFAVFIVLMRLRTRTHRRFDLTCWYFLLYGAGRFVIEGLRTDSLMAFGGLRVSQLLSAGMCLLSSGWFAWHVVSTRRAWLAVPVVAVGLCILFALLPLPLALRHGLMALTAILCSALLYPQTKPED